MPAGGALLRGIAYGDRVVRLRRVFSAREQRAQGWREARVAQIAAGASIERDSPRDCREEAAPDTAANGRYAVYQYRGASNGRRFRIAPLPDNVSLKVGDLVRVNIDDCSVAPTLR